jgi:putative colanic acid biosynthesis acetyltransferase WcaF
VIDQRPIAHRLKEVLKLRHILEVFYNSVVCHIPIHPVRLGYLRLLGARIGPKSTIFRGTTVLMARNLVIGERCVIAWRCYLDARGGIEIGDRVVLASDVHLITAQHDPYAKDFRDSFQPIKLGRYVWLASRATVTMGVTIAEGGVVAAGSVALSDVPHHTIVGGVPARPIGKQRPEDLDYDPTYRPLFY